MILLDENIPEDQLMKLLKWRVRVRQIGFNVGRSGMLDDEIITFLSQQHPCTFFTNDADYYRPHLRHHAYALIYLAVDKNLSALYIRRLLRHPMFNTHQKRMGTVICATTLRLSVWRMKAEREIYIDWD